MKRVNALISLVNSLTKAEKKHISLKLGQPGNDYFVLYEILSVSVKANVAEIKEEFYRRAPEGTLSVAVQYLYEKLLDTILDLRKGKDKSYDLLQAYSKARMLYERSMFEECLELLKDVIENATKTENFEILLLAQKLDLEYRYRLNFPIMDEQELYHKHFIIDDVLTKLREIADQSTLHNLLKFRLASIRSIRSNSQKATLNDLVIREASVVSSSSHSNFELTRNHLLFQSSYLMSVGEYQSALEVLKELDEMFESNPKLRSNPPIYYLAMLEAALDSLRSIGNYDEMKYFTDRLKKIIADTTREFKLNAICLLFQYELFPYIDNGLFTKALEIVEKYKPILYEKASMLSPVRKSELMLYTSIAYFGEQKYHEARRWIRYAVIDHNIKYMPLMKTIRLMQLIIYYELGENDIIQYEANSIIRKLSAAKERAFKTERLILSFVNRNDVPIQKRQREAYLKQLSPKIREIREDKYEHQLLYLFDFISWIESKIQHIPLNKALSRV